MSDRISEIYVSTDARQRDFTRMNGVEEAWDLSFKLEAPRRGGPVCGSRVDDKLEKRDENPGGVLAGAVRTALHVE